MTVSRRNLLKAGALGVSSGPLLLACTSEPVHDDASQTVFRHGVASGDPWPRSVILWTRLSLDQDAAQPSGVYEVFTGLELGEPIVRGEFETDASRDFTVKVEATGLAPGTTYYYRFVVSGVHSPLGRTRTAPENASERLRFGVVSCASLAYGYFHAYRALAERADLDLVVHLGDYIYEHADGAYGSLRGYDPPHELFTLSDYRRRYAQYRSDPNLRELHRQLPLALVWDDHEVANNSWQDGAPEHTAASPVSYAERKRAAQQAYFEWLPIRESEAGRVHRSLGFGDLVHLVLGDTRHWGRAEPLPADDPAVASDARSILGSDQEQWLAAELARTGTRWRLLAQQVVFSALDIGITNSDAWDGYPKNRERLLSWVAAQELANLVILTGDIHMSWAFDVLAPGTDSYDPASGEGSLAVELVTPGITSPGFAEATGELVAKAALELPEVRLAQLWKRGYVLLDIDQQRLQAEWYLFDRVDWTSHAQFYRALHVRAGETHLRESGGPAPEVPNPPPLAPLTES